MRLRIAQNSFRRRKEDPILALGRGRRKRDTDGRTIHAKDELPINAVGVRYKEAIDRENQEYRGRWNWGRIILDERADLGNSAADAFYLPRPSEFPKSLSR